MLSDPCNSVLHPGFWGTQEGLLARVKGTFTRAGSGVDTCGYVIWCADYSSSPTLTGGLNTGAANMFAYAASSASARSTNSTFAPYGSSPESTFEAGPTPAAASLPDPSSSLLDDDLVADMRLISACMKLTYTGKMQDASGQLGFIENLPLSTLMAGGASDQPLSVDEMFQYITKTQRLGTDTYEIVSRVNDTAHIFRDADDAPIEIGSGAVSTLTPLGEAQQPRFFGFCWRGLAAGADNPFVLELTKNIEWRASPRSGFTHAPPVQMGPPSTAATAQRVLDHLDPNWATKIQESAVGTISKFAQIAFAGATAPSSKRSLSGALESMAGRAGLNYANKYLEGTAKQLGGAAMGKFVGGLLPALEMGGFP